MGYQGLNWFQLAQNIIQRLDLVNTVLVRYKTCNFLTNSATLTLVSQGLCSVELRYSVVYFLCNFEGDTNY